MGFDITGESLNNSFFIAFCGIAKLAVKAMMCTEFKEGILFFTFPTNQNLFNRSF